MSQSSELFPYQRMTLSGATAILFRQLQTGEPIAREILLEGRAGTGKSIGALAYLVNACFAWPGIRVLATRLTRTSMTQSTLVTLEEEVLGADHPAVLNGPTRAHRESYDLGGSTLVVCGLDSPGKLFSTAWDIIYVNEAHEIPLESWELFGRAQRPRMKTVIGFRQRICDVNPSYPGHWLNRRAFPCSDDLRRVRSREDYARLQRYNAGPQDGIMRRLVSVHQDNPNYWDWEAWDWTEAGREMLLGLESMSGSRRQRMLEGLWVSAEGAIFPEFSTTRGTGHVVDPFPIPADWPVWMAWDPGRDHPTGIVWVARSPQGVLFACDEIHRSGGHVAAFCDEIKQREASKAEAGYPYLITGRYADPQYAFSETAFHIHSIADQAEELGIHLEPWPRTVNNAKELQMIEDVRRLLISDRLKVFSTCQGLIDNFQSWMWKRNRDGSLPDGEDVPQDANNDLLDPLRGLIAAGIAEMTPRYSVHAPAAPAPAFSEVDWSIERGEVGVRMNRERDKRRTLGVV